MLEQSGRRTFKFDAREVAVALTPLTRDPAPLIAEWEDLESRADQGNVFLSPHFILPAIRNLDPRKRFVALTIRCADRHPQGLLLLGIFIARPPQPQFPLPYLEAYQSAHTFRTGVLIDQSDKTLALSALGEYLSSPTVPWCGLEFEDRYGDTTIDEMARRPDTPRMIRWCQYRSYDRAILRPENAAEALTRLLTEGKFSKELRRKQRRLNELGRVEWRFLAGNAVDHNAIDTFLKLEHQGWKAEHGTSLLSNAAHAEFFRDMVTRFAVAKRAFFTELAIDGRVIASTSNFISGRTAQAFKIGWDQKFAALSPGLLNELELMRHANEFLRNIDTLDSGAEAGSFIERLWPERQAMTSGIITGGYAGATVRPAIQLARRLKGHLRDVIHQAKGSVS